MKGSTNSDEVWRGVLSGHVVQTLSGMGDEMMVVWRSGDGGGEGEAEGHKMAASNGFEAGGVRQELDEHTQHAGANVRMQDRFNSLDLLGCGVCVCGVCVCVTGMRGVWGGEGGGWGR